MSNPRDRAASAEQVIKELESEIARLREALRYISTAYSDKNHGAAKVAKQALTEGGEK